MSPTWSLLSLITKAPEGRRSRGCEGGSGHQPAFSLEASNEVALSEVPRAQTASSVHQRRWQGLKESLRGREGAAQGLAEPV